MAFQQHKKWKVSSIFLIIDISKRKLNSRRVREIGIERKNIRKGMETESFLDSNTSAERRITVYLEEGRGPEVKESQYTCTHLTISAHMRDGAGNPKKFGYIKIKLLFLKLLDFRLQLFEFQCVKNQTLLVTLKN